MAAIWLRAMCCLEILITKALSESGSGLLPVNSEPGRRPRAKRVRSETPWAVLPNSVQAVEALDQDSLPMKPITFLFCFSRIIRKLIETYFMQTGIDENISGYLKVDVKPY